MREGKAAEAGHAYPHQQVYLLKPNGKGYWKLDFYDPFAGEIISFKDTQLASIKVKSAIGYLNELVRKYKPGRKIADVPSTSKDLLGKSLEGRMILEVPAQTNPIPQKVLDAAKKRDILIRDVKGKVY
jgi:filamentous hemagglutinin